MKRSTLVVAALSFISFTAVASAQLAVNGGFESGSFSPGWTATDPNPTNFILIDSASNEAHSGNFCALLGSSPDPGTLLQTLNTTPGQTYSVSFWLASDLSSTVSNSFEVLWNGVSVLSLTDVPALAIPLNPYVNFSIANLAATSGATDLEFRFVNNDDFFRLDDITVNVVPETSTIWLTLIGFGFLASVCYRRHKVSRLV